MSFFILLAAVVATWSCTILLIVSTAYNWLPYTIWFPWVMYEVASICSIHVFRKQLQYCESGYLTATIGNIKAKSQSSLNIRSLRIFSKISIFSTLRVAVSAIIMYFCVTYFPNRCQYETTLKLAQIHDFVFEILEALLPVYLFMKEDFLRYLPCFCSKRRQSVLVPINVLGRELIMDYKGEDYFKQLNDQWKIKH
ncbi:unnamed protein product [Bursaphelenchus okinawaensis]|uniref:Uncharacterized protein n=1 Tax=Bursaphelenchus okinawaensis TaxID=465554 RepID=A0A811KTF9_9BILA|nr:unnamed protein product [Bursaphelenchus okinawaensis]CAG9109936.1 unnamed protein product [Bursaphelenchus okinawaensis]